MIAVSDDMHVSQHCQVMRNRCNMTMGQTREAGNGHGTGFKVALNLKTDRFSQTFQKDGGAKLDDSNDATMLISGIVVRPRLWHTWSTHRMKAPRLPSIPWTEIRHRGKQTALAIGNFGRRLWIKINQDEILFLASGMAFNVLLCLLPILLLLIYMLGIWFQSGETIRFVDSILATVFPNQPYALAIRENISSILAEIVAQRKSLGLLSLAVLMVASASLFSSMRSVLHRVFEVRARRHFVISYLFDLLLVLGVTLLILLTTSLRWIYGLIRRIEDFMPGEVGRNFHDLLGIAPDLISAGVVVLLCYLLYRHVPTERTPTRIAFISAVTTCVIWEISGRLFAWYLGTLTSFNKTYGAYAFLIVLMVWIFYSSVIFVFGAEVGQVSGEQSQGIEKN